MRTKAGRYVLEDRVLDGVAWSYWRGYDGVLRRPVGVLALEPGHPAEEEVLAAARSSSAVEDPRLQRVLDVLSDDEGTALVTEWMAGSSVEELLDDGPVPDVESWRITLEVARALARADAQGLHHGALAPQWVLRGDGGRVRVLGLCVASALAHPGQPAGPAADAHGLGCLLYALLTGRWPGDPDWSALPAAPRQGGRPVRSRMVRAGVPGVLDEVAARALGLPGRGAPLSTPAAVAAALELAGDHMRGFDASGPIELDAAVLAELADTGYVERVNAEIPEPPAPAGGSARRRAGLVGVVAALVVLAGAVGFGVRALGGDDTAAASPGAASSGSAAASGSASAEPTGQRVPIVAVTDFDPKPAGNGSENHKEVGAAIDGDPDTAWHTVVYYRRPNLGGLKDGVGLLVDLGSPQDVGAVRLRLVGHGTSVELRADTKRDAQAVDYFPVAHQDDWTGTMLTLKPEGPLKARYLLVWLTSLPLAAPLAPDGSPSYQGGIAEIEVYRS